jgi:hypothetical protein
VFEIEFPFVLVAFPNLSVDVHEHNEMCTEFVFRKVLLPRALGHIDPFTGWLIASLDLN